GSDKPEQHSVNLLSPQNFFHQIQHRENHHPPAPRETPALYRARSTLRSEARSHGLVLFPASVRACLFIREPGVSRSRRKSLRWDIFATSPSSNAPPVSRLHLPKSFCL